MGRDEAVLGRYIVNRLGYGLIILVLLLALNVEGSEKELDQVPQRRPAAFVNVPAITLGDWYQPQWMQNPQAFSLVEGHASPWRLMNPQDYSSLTESTGFISVDQARPPDANQKNSIHRQY